MEGRKRRTLIIGLLWPVSKGSIPFSSTNEIRGLGTNCLTLFICNLILSRCRPAFKKAIPEVREVNTVDYAEDTCPKA